MTTGTPALGRTGRGVMHREGDRLVRVLDPRLCDERFRTALAGLWGSRPPRTLPIVAAGPVEDGYRIEYAAEGVVTLGEAYARTPHWPGRLALAARACEALDHWCQARIAGLGLDPHTVVLGDAGDVLLAPCPPVRLESARDLFGTDPVAIAAIAPEVVRGLPSQQRAEDTYAVGTLAALALGCRPAELGGDAERIEAQARGVLLRVSAAGSEVEPFLHETPRLRALLTTIHRCRNEVADARPADPGELRLALRAVADSAGLAEDLWRAGDAAGARRVLSFSDGGLRQDWLAGRICAAMGDGPSAMEHYERAVGIAPGQFELRQQRCDDLWALWQAEPDAPPGWSPALLDDLNYLREHGDPGRAEHRLREAAVHERSGDLYRAAAALHEATTLDPDSFAVLLRYARCLRGIGDREGRSEVPELADINQVVCRRLETMRRIPSITEEEAQRWCDDFKAV